MFTNKNVLVIGYGKTGKSLADFLNRNNANVIVYDDNIKCNEYKNFENTDLSQIDFAIISPGIDLSNPIVSTLKKLNIKLSSELDFSFQFSSNYVIAITGTNGKTTCVNLLYEILKTANKKCELCGNVGVPVIDKISNDKKQILIVEVSSFQLESSNIFRPDIACILNIFPDHIIRHKTFECYKNVKYKIYKNQNKKNYLIVNKNIELNSNISPQIKLFYKENIYSYNIKNNYILYKNKKVINIDKIKLKGEKNLENILAVLEICKVLKIKHKYIVKALQNFIPLHHRQEILLVKNNVTYVNDSKSTNVSSTLSALQNFKNIILLLGGSDKGYEYDDIFKNDGNVKSFIVFGEVKEKLKETAKRYSISVKDFDNMEDAVIYSTQIATSNDVVLLSPASASFDEFSSYKERGEKFAQIIKDL